MEPDPRAIAATQAAARKAKASRAEMRRRNLEPKDWQDTMTKEELKFLWGELYKLEAWTKDSCIDNHRACRYWISSQRRRYFKQRDHGCCGFADRLVKRWSPEKNRWDIYLIGLNYGH